MRAVAPDQRVGGTVVRERRAHFGLRAVEFGNDPLGEDLTEFDAPLIERVDVPDHALHEHGMFVERDEFAERRRRQFVHQDRVRRAVAREHAVRHEPVGRAFGLDLRRRLAERERFALSEHVRHAGYRDAAPSGFCVLMKPMKSHGISRVP